MYNKIYKSRSKRLKFSNINNQRILEARKFPFTAIDAKSHLKINLNI